MSSLPFACRCGTVRGRVTEVPAGTHARCYCRSCRAAAIHTGEGDPGQEGVTVWQTTPDRIEFDSGADHLAVFSFGEKNLLRWQASCCGAALFNTMRSPQMPFAALHTPRLADTAALGPVSCAAFKPLPIGKARHENKRKMVGVVLRMLGARLSSRWRKTPFFRDGAPVSEVQVLPPGTRERLVG